MEPFYFLTFACVYIEVLISCMTGWSDRLWSFEQKRKRKKETHRYARDASGVLCLQVWASLNGK